MKIRCKRFLVAIAAMCSAVGLIGGIVFAQGVSAAQGTNPSLMADQIPDSESNSLAQAAVAEAATIGRIVFGLRPIRKQYRTEGWATVTYRNEKIATNDRPRKAFLDPELLMYARKADTYYCVFRSGTLIDPRMKDWPADAMNLDCLDLNCDAIDEVVITQWRRGASWTPGCAFVFKLLSKQLIHLATLTSHYEIKIERFDGYDYPVIPVTFAIGKTLAHVDQPRWTDYYRFDGQHMVSANSLLPQQFRHWPGELERVLTEHPDDPEIWYYLGVARKILDQRKDSERAFARAKSLGYQGAVTEALQAGLGK